MAVGPTGKVNKAKKSTGKVTFHPKQGLYNSQAHNNDKRQGNLPQQYVAKSIDPMEEIIEKSSTTRDFTKMSNLDPFIIVCQEEKLTKIQLDHLSKQWEVYEMFIKELEYLSKKIPNLGDEKPQPYKSNTKFQSLQSVYNGNKVEVEISTNKRIRKPKTIYSPPHSVSFSHSGSEENSYFYDEDLSRSQLHEIKPKKKYVLPKLKLLSGNINSSNKLKKVSPPINYMEEEITTNEIESVDDESINLVEYYYGNRVENINNVTMDKLKNQKTPILMRCSKCDHSFMDNIAAMLHVLKHVQPEFEKLCAKETRCQHCFRSFSTVADRDTHVMKVHTPAFDQDTMCLLCEIHFPAPVDLKRHMNRLHNAKEMPFWCNLCEAHSSSYNELLNHFRMTHSNSNYLLCPFCLIVIKTPYPKPGALFRYSRLDLYEAHIERHIKEAPAQGVVESEATALVSGPTHGQCSLCRLNFCHDIQYTKHRDVHHVAHGNDSFHKNTILPVQLPQKLFDIWSCYGDVTPARIDGMVDEARDRDTVAEQGDDEGTGKEPKRDNNKYNKTAQSYASTRVIRKPMVDLRQYMPDDEEQAQDLDEINDMTSEDQYSESYSQGGEKDGVSHSKFAHPGSKHRKVYGPGSGSKSLKQAQMKKRQEIALAAKRAGKGVKGRPPSSKAVPMVKPYTAATTSPKVDHKLDKSSPEKRTPGRKSAEALSTKGVPETAGTPNSAAPKFHVAADVLIGQTCMECHKVIRSSDHFRRRKRCKICEYSTCCYKALDRHQKNKGSHLSNLERSESAKSYVLNDGGYAMLATMPDLKLVNLDDYLVKEGYAILCSPCDSTFYDQSFFMNHLTDKSPNQKLKCRQSTYKLICNAWLTKDTTGGRRRKIPMTRVSSGFNGSGFSSPLSSILKRNSTPIINPPKKLKVEFDLSSYEENQSVSNGTIDQTIDPVTVGTGHPLISSFNTEDFVEGETILPTIFEPLTSGGVRAPDNEGISVAIDTKGNAVGTSPLADLMNIITGEPSNDILLTQDQEGQSPHISMIMPLTDDATTGTTDSITTINV